MHEGWVFSALSELKLSDPANQAASLPTGPSMPLLRITKGHAERPNCTIACLMATFSAT